MQQGLLLHGRETEQLLISQNKGLENSIQLMVRMIQEHATDLEEMAKVYQESDKAAADEASGLVTDVIQ